MTPGVAATALRGRGSGPGDRADRARAGQLLLGTGIDSLGSGLSAGAAMLYFFTMVVLAPGAVKLAMSAGALLGILTPVPVGRLADRYGLETVPIAGLSPEVEPAPRDLEEVAELVEEHGATTVFVEPLLSPEVGETVAREAGAETAVLDPLEGLSEENLAAGEDYFSVMRANLDVLREGLGCR